MKQSGALILRATVGAAAAALAVVVLVAGEPERLSWWPGAAAFWLWMISPAVAAGLLAGRAVSGGRLLVEGLYLIGFILSAAIGYYHGLLRPVGSTSSLIVIFLPLYQWAALIVVLIARRGFALLVRRHSRNRVHR